jgi:hypothetical protein
MWSPIYSNIYFLAISAIRPKAADMSRVHVSSSMLQRIRFKTPASSRNPQPTGLKLRSKPIATGLWAWEPSEESTDCWDELSWVVLWPPWSRTMTRWLSGNSIRLHYRCSRFASWLGQWPSRVRFPCFPSVFPVKFKKETSSILRSLFSQRFPK